MWLQHVPSNRKTANTQTSRKQKLVRAVVGRGSPRTVKACRIFVLAAGQHPRFLLFLLIRMDSLRPPVVRLSADLTTGLRFVIHFQLPGSELLSEKTYTPWTVFVQKHSQKSVSEKHTFRTMHYFLNWY